MTQTDESPAEAGQLDLDLGADVPVRAAPDAPLIAVIDDEQAARRSTAWLLAGEGYRVLPFADGSDFLAAPLPGHVACVLLDMRMPGMSGLDVLRALDGRDEAPPVIVVTGHADIAMVVAAMRLGAADFIEKPYAPEALLRAIRRSAESRDEARAAQAASCESRALVDRLPVRQRQVLAGIVGGRPNKVIAWQLGLSVRTVEAYRAQLFSRLGARSTAEAVRIALVSGMEAA